MNDAIIVALITAGATLIGVIISNRGMLEKQAANIDRELGIYQARTNERIDELTREVREHNEVIKRTYAVEEQIKQLARRTDGLEQIARNLRNN